MGDAKQKPIRLTKAQERLLRELPKLVATWQSTAWSLRRKGLAYTLERGDRSMHHRTELGDAWLANAGAAK